MPFSPSIQSYIGAHGGGTSGFGGAVGVAINWATNELFQMNQYLTRYGVLSGLEEAFATLVDMGGVGENGVDAFIGLAASGDIFISATGSLYNGAAMLVDGTSLSMINLIGYPAPNFGTGGMIGVTYGTHQYCVDKGVGDNIIATLNRINEITTTTWLNFQDYTGIGGNGCAGAVGTGVVYIFSAPLTPQTGPATLSKIQFDNAGFVSNTVIGTVTMSSIDSGWTDQFHSSGMCLDQTDGMLLVTFQGSGNSNKAYITKIDPSDASVVWKAIIPAAGGGGPVTVGNPFSYSDIRNGRVGFYSGGPLVTIYDTSDGSIADQYSTGLNGLFPRQQGQAYNDTLGCVVLGTDFTQTSGSPTLLNSTPTTFSDGYAALYVASPLSPRGRRYLNEHRPVRIIP